MGAIFGCFGRRASADGLTDLSRALSHRGHGPDTIFVHAEGGLGCRPSRAAECSAEATLRPPVQREVRAVLDGTIHNAAALRQELRGENRELASESDEALVEALYARAGPDGVQRLRGPFALAIWDSERRQLVLARDHVGHKPLFYADNDRGLYFASEPRALLEAGVVPFEVDGESLSHFLSLRFVPAPHSLIRGVRKLPPAHVLICTVGGTTLRRYWALSFERKLTAPEEEITAALQHKLSETIAAHLRDGVPTGSFLSAGLDSGLIVATMAEVLAKPFHTFSLGVANESDEVPAARLVAARFNTIQHEAYAQDDVVRLLPAMIWHLAEPSDIVVVSKYLAAKLAAPHVQAVMSGDGGDELFAGFHRYLGIRDARYFAYVPPIIRNRIIGPLACLLGGRRAHTSPTGKLHWLTEVTGAGGLAERYAEAVAYLRFRSRDKQQLFTPEVWRDISAIDSNQILIDEVSRSDAEDPVEQLLSADFTTRLPEHLLMLDDRTGAAHGIDVMCPLADKELAELGAAIPANLKIRGRQTKYIERQLARRMLPDEIVNYEKTGWSFPFAALCAGALQPFLRSVVASSRLAEDGIFRRSFMEQVVTEHGTRHVDHHIRIWMLLSLEIWYRLTADGLRPDDLRPWMEQHLAASRSA